jgi:hypothetical protein
MSTPDDTAVTMLYRAVPDITDDSPTHTFDQLENAVYAWGWARGIIQNGKPMGQAIKTLEETTELLDALNKDDLPAIKDAIGDVVVTLIMVCGTLGLEITPCLELAYREIKDRKGFLGADGVFVKAPA